MSIRRAASLDDLVRERFLGMSRSVDDLLCHPADAQRFADDVNRAIGDALPVDRILRRLVALRKLGHERGGLPRTQRAYRGRGSNPR